MIKIASNKIKTSDVLIPEEVYVRTMQDSREGEVETLDSIPCLRFFYDYRAYLKSKWDEKIAEGKKGIEANTITVDSLDRGNIVLIPVLKPIVSANLAELSLFFNREYKDHLKTCLGILEEDITIIQM